MAVSTLTNTPNVLNLAESVTGWQGDSFTFQSDLFLQGTGGVECSLTNNGNNDVFVNDFTPANLNATHLRLWFNITFLGNLSSINPIQAFISDGTNTAYWDIGFEYTGGWANIVVDTSATPLSGTKPTGNSTQVGIRFVTSSKPRNVPANAYFDAWYYGDGYTVTGGTNGDEINWESIFLEDNNNSYGVVKKIDDIYFLSGDISIGIGATTTFFKSAEKVQFQDLPVNENLYSVSFSGSGLNVDIIGGSYGAAGNQNYIFDASDTLMIFKALGVQFEKGIPSFGAGGDAQNLVFDNCGQVDPSTAIFKFNSFRNYQGLDGGALLYPNDDTNISDLSFQSFGTGHGMELSENGTSTRTFENISNTGYGANNTTDSFVNYTGASSFDLSYNNGTEPTVNPTILVTVLQNQKTLTLTGLNNPTKVYLMNTSLNETDPNFILDSQLITSGVYTYSFTESININALYRIVNLTSNVIEQDVFLGANNLIIPISQQIDRVYENN